VPSPPEHGTTWLERDISGASRSYRENWAAWEREYAAEFSPPIMDQGDTGSCTRHIHDDMVDSMRYASRAAETVNDYNPVHRWDVRDIRPFPAMANPTVRIEEILHRRFDLIDRRAHVLEHPLIAAVIRAKTAPAQGPLKDPCPPPTSQKLNVWERLRANYALFA
jgi:hypothetical protein